MYDFNTSGKYKILKEKIKKSIVKICMHKFKKEGNFTGITTDTRDQFYSDIYVFLMKYMRKTLAKFIKLKNEDLHHDIATRYDQSLIERDDLLE